MAQPRGETKMLYTVRRAILLTAFVVSLGFAFTVTNSGVANVHTVNTGPNRHFFSYTDPFLRPPSLGFWSRVPNLAGGFQVNQTSYAHDMNIGDGICSIDTE